MTKATVLVPTHEHDRTLPYAIRSALAQSQDDLEVLIVGDGPTQAVAEAAEALAHSDGRVRFFAFPKGERHGEAHRHEVLKRARGEVVAYLSDDDLWLPDHLSIMVRLAAEEGLVHTQPTYVSETGRVRRMDGSSADMLDGRNHIPLSAMGHSLSTYLGLPNGWSPAPPDIYTDLFMWRKFLVAGFGLKTSAIPTVVHFPSPARASWSPERRRLEIESWARLAAEDPDRARAALLGDILARPPVRPAKAPSDRVLKVSRPPKATGSQGGHRPIGTRARRRHPSNG